MFVLVSCSKQRSSDDLKADEQPRKSLQPQNQKAFDYALHAELYPDSITPYVDTAKVLNAIYSRSKTRNDSVTQNIFFSSFPSTFVSFEIIYGNVLLMNDLPTLLSMQCEEHIGYFFGAHEVNKKVFFQKVTNIAAHGRWDADGVSVFQEYLLRYLDEKADDVIVSVWLQMDDADLISFFTFILDGPHPSLEYSDNVKRLVRENPRLEHSAIKAQEIVRGGGRIEKFTL